MNTLKELFLHAASLMLFRHEGVGLSGKVSAVQLPLMIVFVAAGIFTTKAVKPRT